MLTISDKQFISQLLNSNVIPYDMKLHYIKIANINFSYRQDIFGRIVIEQCLNEDITIQDLVTGLFSIDNSKEKNILYDLKASHKNRMLFDRHVENLFCKKKINNEFLNHATADQKNNVFSRIIDREPECGNYVFMFRNYLDSCYRIENNLTLELPLVKIDNYKNMSTDNKRILEFFDGLMPVHPANTSILHKNKIVKTINCYFSASHRTFTNEDLPIYFKLDIPTKISASNRMLTRHESRIMASEFAKRNMPFENNGNKYYVLNDIKAGNINGNNIMIRIKEQSLLYIPLFSLLKVNQTLLNNKCFLDIILEKQADFNRSNYVLNRIVFPIIHVFYLFVNISGNAFIQPYNYHRQNINLSYSDNNITGIVVQDLDMSRPLNAHHYYNEYDEWITYTILEPIGNYLENKRYMKKNDYINNIKDYYQSLFMKYKFLYSNDANNSYFENIIYKDIGIKPMNDYYIAGPNPYRL